MTREEATNNVFMGLNLRHIVHTAVGFVDAMWLSRTDVITFIDKLFDEHDTQIKGLKQIIQKQSDLLEMYSVDNEVQNNAYLVAQLKAKDASITEYSQLLTKFEQIFDEKNKIILQLIKDQKRHDKKTRSIVAMLFWEWRNSRSHQKAMWYKAAFQQAYKMLKGN